VRERRSGQFGRTPRSHVHARNTCFSHALVARARERVCATRIWIKHRSRFSDVERIKRRLILGHRLQILRVHGSQQRSREMSASCLRLPIMIRSFLSEAYQNTSTSRGDLSSEQIISDESYSSIARYQRNRFTRRDRKPKDNAVIESNRRTDRPEEKREKTNYFTAASG